MGEDDDALAGARLVRLEEIETLKEFDCSDIDLNDFFVNDSRPSQKNLITVTYIIENDNETIAFYSLLNDKITKEDAPSGRKWNLFRDKKFHQSKRFSSYPCVKLARLGVNSKYQSKGIGEFILNNIKKTFVDNNRTGCRFITVDAYNNTRTLNFYSRNNFIFLPNKDEKPDDKTKLMYYDLIAIVNAQREKSNERSDPISDHESGLSAAE